MSLQGGADAGVVIGHQVDAGLVQVLAEAFVVGEEEGFVLLTGAAERRRRTDCAESRERSAVEEVAGIEGVIAQEFVDRAVQLIGSGLRDDENLCAGAFAIFGAVGIGEHVEFADCVDAEQLLAGAAGLHVVFRRAGEFDAVQQEEILLRAVALDCEVVADSGIGNADAAGLLPSEVDDAGIKGEEFVVTAAVEREVFDLFLVYDARDIGGGDVDNGSIAFDGDLLAGGTYAKRDVDCGALRDDEMNAGADTFGETVFTDTDFIKAEGK